MDLYRLLKFLHLAAVILWIGSAFTMTVLVLSVTRTRDRALMASLIRHVGRYAGAVMGPTSILTLLSGVGMLIVIGLSPSTFWVQWGMAGILVHFVLGGWFIRRATARLGTLAATPEASDAAIAAQRRRLALLDGAYLTLLLAVVGAMTVKPSL